MNPLRPVSCIPFGELSHSPNANHCPFLTTAAAARHFSRHHADSPRYWSPLICSRHSFPAQPVQALPRSTVSRRQILQNYPATISKQLISIPLIRSGQTQEVYETLPANSAQTPRPFCYHGPSQNSIGGMRALRLAGPDMLVKC